MVGVGYSVTEIFFLLSTMYKTPSHVCTTTVNIRKVYLQRKANKKHNNLRDKTDWWEFRSWRKIAYIFMAREWNVEDFFFLFCFLFYFAFIFPFLFSFYSNFYINEVSLSGTRYEGGGWTWFTGHLHKIVSNNIWL